MTFGTRTRISRRWPRAATDGGASIFLVEGTDASPAESAQPAATTPAGDSFSVTFTAEASDVGDWTVWGLIEGSECGDADALTVTAALPDVAMAQPSPLVFIGWLMAFAGFVLGLRRLASIRG